MLLHARRSLLNSFSTSNVAAETSFRLPLQSAPAFPALFDELDESLESLGLLSYGVSGELFRAIETSDLKPLTRSDHA